MGHAERPLLTVRNVVLQDGPATKKRRGSRTSDISEAEAESSDGDEAQEEEDEEVLRRLEGGDDDSDADDDERDGSDEVRCSRLMITV